ncbi:10554_t:CDS:2, partial [Dentiscutata erythropus]
ELGSISQHLQHSDRSIHATTFSSDTTTIFESNTEQQFYQSAEIPEDITNIQFPTLTTKFSFSSNSTDLLEADFYTPTPSSIIPPTDLINQEMDTDSIDELVLYGAPPSYLTEKQEQIRPSTPKTIINVEQGNLFDNNNNQVEYISIYPTIDNTPIVNYWEADQPQDNTKIDPWNPTTDPQFRQVPLFEDTVLQLPGGFSNQQPWDHNQSQSISPTGSDYIQVHTIDYTTLFANNEFAGDSELETTKSSEEELFIVESSEEELSENAYLL